MSLDGRVAGGTGGGGHLGQAMAEALGELGACLVLVDIGKAESEAAAWKLRTKLRVDALALVVDLADEGALAAVPRKVLSEFGSLDILINNAALGGTSPLPGWSVPFADQPSATWRLALEVNLTAPFVLTSESAPALAVSGHGSGIDIGSLSALSRLHQHLAGGTS